VTGKSTGKRQALAAVLGLAILVGGFALPAAPAHAQRAARLNLAPQAQEPTVTSIAFQPFQHGFMLWRQDTGQITVAYADILTKTGAACQELYRDTYTDQAYDIPPAPAGLGVPTMGFGWLYASDSQLARRLGYATGDEVSRVAEIRTSTAADGAVSLQLRLSEPVAGQPNPLTVGQSDEPGLTYCFARAGENRSALNTWVAIQRFQHGYMQWRQDRPDRIDVIHYDTEFAPELSCLDIFSDAWTPGATLSYGDLAVPGRRLPERGFGKIWVDNAYVRDSLGYPTEAERGGFAEITFEPFQHPRRGQLLVRQTVIQLASGNPFRQRATFSGSGDPERENRVSQGCSRILIPHTTS
jgi:hypothetical protein